jgi:hypothetical protein
MFHCYISNNFNFNISRSSASLFINEIVKKIKTKHREFLTKITDKKIVLIFITTNLNLSLKLNKIIILFYKILRNMLIAANE